MDIVTTPTQTNYNFLGVCEFCGLEMGPMIGIPKSKRLQYHILRKCKKYPPSIPATSRTTPPPPPPPPTMPVPPTGSSDTVEANKSYRTQRDSVKPKPKVCKKKKGACNHVIAFGEHYDRNDWKIYEDFLSAQRPETNISNI